MRLAKLTSGQIIYVFETNHPDRTMYGISLSSPKRRHKNYSFRKIDPTWDHDIGEIIAAYNAIQGTYDDHKYLVRDRLTKRQEGKLFSRDIFEEREKNMLNEINTIQNQYKQAV